MKEPHIIAMTCFYDEQGYFHAIQWARVLHFQYHHPSRALTLTFESNMRLAVTLPEGGIEKLRVIPPETDQ
jgi:hypothetical protein